MLRLARCLSGALLVMAVSVPAAAAVDDNFDDNSMSSMWTLVQDDPARLWLEETNQRLELRANQPLSASNDALYLSDGPVGFQIKTSSDFAVSIDYSYTGFTGTGSIALDLGIGRDVAGTDSAAVAYFRSSNFILDGALGAAYRVSNVETVIPINYVGNVGTFTVSYASAIDRLTLGAGLDTIDLDGLVKGQWNADKVWVSFGGRGDGLVLASGDAFLDNLTVTGDYVIIPEPAGLALLLAGSALLLKRRTRL